MTRSEILGLIDGSLPLPVAGFFSRPLWEYGFQNLGELRRRLLDRTERARSENADDERVELAERCVSAIDGRLRQWLEEWDN
jgi:hypothetical protein